jgi:pimeloyl-ACP methyl ester carboxylesterase
VGINYVNGVAVGQLCATEPDRDCHGKVRQEVITGQDTSALVSVGPVDSIVNRLAKLLIALNQQYPSEGWDQYLNNQLLPDWSKINLAGHSQGGGHAGLMARMYNLNRAAYFSSPADWRNFANQPATWMSMPSITPVSRQYGFTHLSDPLVPYSNIVPIWQALQLDTLGPVASVDGSASPWGGSHQLTTNATPGSNLPTAAHGATVFDVSVPRSADGSPSFRSVWSAMLYP